MVEVYAPNLINKEFKSQKNLYLYYLFYRIMMIRIKNFKRITIIFTICSILWIFKQHLKTNQDHDSNIMIVQLNEKIMMTEYKETTIVNS